MNININEYFNYFCNLQKKNKKSNTVVQVTKVKIKQWIFDFIPFNVYFIEDIK